MKQSDVFEYDESNGMFTIYIRTKNKATRLLKEKFNEIKSKYNYLDNIEFDESKVVEAKAYSCKDCEYYTVGDNVCNECSEDIKGKGIKTFTYLY